MRASAPTHVLAHAHKFNTHIRARQADCVTVTDTAETICTNRQSHCDRAQIRVEYLCNLVVGTKISTPTDEPILLSLRATTKRLGTRSTRGRWRQRAAFNKLHLQRSFLFTRWKKKKVNGELEAEVGIRFSPVFFLSFSSLPPPPLPLPPPPPPNKPQSLTWTRSSHHVPRSQSSLIAKCCGPHCVGLLLARICAEQKFSYRQQWQYTDLICTPWQLID